MTPFDRNAEIEVGPLLKEEISYVWLDEDGEQMSPTHKTLRSALNFVGGFKARWKRVQGLGNYVEETVSKTGKPPVKLQRVIVRSYAADLTPEQQSIVDTFLEELPA